MDVPSVRIVVLLACVACAGVTAALLLPHSPGALRDEVLAVGPLAPLVALAAWVLLVPALFPGTVLAAGCGLTFGAAGGSALAFAGAVGGGLAAFGLARTVGRDGVARLVARRPALDRARRLVERHGFATLLIARLLPGVPAGGLHYAAGAAPVRARAFAGAMAVGAVLRTVPYALLGSCLAGGSPMALALAGGSIVVGALAAALMARRLRRATLAVA
jgi:uncharacterized membrane protein YdjX (TVP38/TMEM64 family)